MIGKLTRTIVRTFAFALALCATTSAWAVAPTATAVWEGNFDVPQNGYSITLPSGMTYSKSTTGNIVIGSTAKTGAIIELNEAVDWKVSVLIKYSHLYAVAGKKVSLATVKDSAGNVIGIRSTANNALTTTGFYNGSDTGYSFVSGQRAQTGSGYLLFSYNPNDGTFAYTGRTINSLSGGKNGTLRWGGKYIDKLSIGGPVESGKTEAWAGVVIEKVALFVGEAYTNENIADYAFPSQTRWHDTDTYAYRGASSGSYFHLSNLEPVDCFDTLEGDPITLDATTDSYYWKKFASNQGATYYKAPGCALFYDKTGYTAQADCTFGLLSFGGLYVTSEQTTGVNPVYYSIIGSGERNTELGDPDGKTETYFVFDKSFTIRRSGDKTVDTKLYGVVNVAVTSDMTFDLNSAPYSSDHASIKSVLTTAGTTAPVLKMSGGGKFKVYELDASIGTLDFSGVTATPFIEGNPSVTKDTKLVFPAGTAAGDSYVMCSGTLTAPTSIIKTTVQVGNGSPFMGYVTYNAETKSVSYSTTAPAYTCTVDGSSSTWSADGLTAEDFASANVTFTGSGTVEFGADATSITVGAGVTVIASSPSLSATVMLSDATSVLRMGTTGTLSGGISGSGVLEIADSVETTVPLSVTFSHTGGTTIGDNAKLTAPYASSAWGYSVTGGNTARVVLTGTSDVTSAAKSGFQSSSTWTGTVELGSFYIANLFLTHYGNASSTVCANGTSAYFPSDGWNDSNNTTAQNVKAFEIGAGGLSMPVNDNYNKISKKRFLFPCKLTGTGTFTLGLNAYAANEYNYVVFTGDVSEFQGVFNTGTGNGGRPPACVVFAATGTSYPTLSSETLSRFASDSGSFHFLSGKTVTFNANSTWTAKGGYYVDGTLTVGSGAELTIDGALTVPGTSAVIAGNVTVRSGAILSITTESPIMNVCSGTLTLESGAIVKVNGTTVASPVVIDGSIASSTSCVWGAGTTGEWDTNANWITGAAPSAENAVVLRTANATITVSESSTAGDVSVDESTTIAGTAAALASFATKVNSITVASGKTLTLSCTDDGEYTFSKAIVGAGSFAVSRGTVTLSGASTFSGNMIVCANTTAKAGASGTAGNGGSGPFGPKVTAASVASATRRVEVLSGGTIDMNGYAEMRYFFKLAGNGINENGALINTGSEVGSSKANVSGIELAGDASIGGSGNFGIIAGGYETTVFDLAGHTLSKKGNNTVWVINGSKKANSTKGTLKVESGVLSVDDGGPTYNRTTNLSDTAVQVAGGSLTINGAFNIGALTQNGGTITVNESKTLTAADTVTVNNGGEMEVNGTLELTKDHPTNTFTGLTAQAGSSITIGENGTLNATSNNTTFYLNGAVEVDGSFICNGEVITASTATIDVSGDGKFVVKWGLRYNYDNESAGGAAGNAGTITIPSVSALTDSTITTKINNLSTGKVVFKPTDTDVGTASIGAFTDYIVVGDGSVEIDVTNLTLPTGTDKLTLFATTTALDLTKFAVSDSDYYLLQNAQNAETAPGAVTLQLHAAKDTAGNYYDDVGNIYLALTGNKVLTILDSQGETYATTFASFGAVYDDTTKELFLAVAQIGETKYPSLSAAKTDLGSNEGTITLLRPSTDSISLAAGQVFNTNGQGYGGTVSSTGDHIEVAISEGVYTAVDNSSNTWIGAPDGAWGTASNWEKGVVPNTYTAVTLPDKTGASYAIGVTNNDKCGTMEVNGNVTLFRATDGWKQLHINGNISGSGTLTLNMVGLRADSGESITVSCDFVGDGGTDNAFVAGKPFTFTKPVTICSTTGYFKSEGVAVVFEDAVTIEAGATLKSHTGTIQSGSDIVLRSSTGIKASGGSLTLSDGVLSGPGSVIVTDNYNMSFTLRTSIVSTSNFSVGNTGVAELTVDDGGVLKVGSASSHKWFTFLTGKGNSDGNSLTINEGGTVEACVITFDGNASERCPYSVNFNGGTLRTYCGQDYYKELIHDTAIQVNVLAGGAKVEVPATYTAKINPVMASGAAVDGGLTKLGDGSLVVGSADYLPTYNGKTKVVAGALYLPSGYTPNLDVTTQETTSDMSGYKKYVFVPAARFGEVSYNTAAEAIAAAEAAGSGTVTLLRDCVEDITLDYDVALTLNSDGETARTLTTTTPISLSRGQTITLGENVALSPVPTTSVGGGAKVVLDGYTYKVVYGTIFSVY